MLVLSSNDPAASVPASVTIPEGATSASFSVSMQSVSATTSAVISGSYGGATRSATRSVNPSNPTPTDPVAITRAEYNGSKQDCGSRRRAPHRTSH